mmetsp:Transcript_32258/g.74799  ORF Transcript_32258/g.74799 Transcript_32258/m.74799 type:complete len:216 (+) Transcript_32258:152-799(+)
MLRLASDGADLCQAPADAEPDGPEELPDKAPDGKDAGPKEFPNARDEPAERARATPGDISYCPTAARTAMERSPQGHPARARSLSNARPAAAEHVPNKATERAEDAPDAHPNRGDTVPDRDPATRDRSSGRSSPCKRAQRQTIPVAVAAQICTVRKARGEAPCLLHCTLHVRSLQRGRRQQHHGCQQCCCKGANGHACKARSPAALRLSSLRRLH